MKVMELHLPIPPEPIDPLVRNILFLNPKLQLDHDDGRF